MERDDRVFLMGEEVGHYQGAYKVSEGMLEKFGERRVIDTPIAEGGFAGIGVGAAMVGPPAHHRVHDVELLAPSRSIRSSTTRRRCGRCRAASSTARSSSAARTRARARSAASTRTRWSTSTRTIPGIKVVAPAFPADAKGLMKAAIRDDNPVLLHGVRDALLREGRGPRRRRARRDGQGADRPRRAPTCTIVAYSRMTHVALEAAAALEKEGISAEVVDLRSLRPLDEDTIADSVRRTHRCVVVHEGWPYGGVGAEICDRVQRARVRLARRARSCASRSSTSACRTTRSSNSCACRRPARVVDAVKRVVHRGRPHSQRREPPEPWRRSSTCRSSRRRWRKASSCAWHKNEGDAVDVDDLLAEVETDKATMEFRAFDKGTLLKLLVPAGREREARPAGGDPRRRRART